MENKISVQHFIAVGEGRFFIDLEGKQAELLYRLEDNVMDLYHTFTPEELRGRGLAEQLTQKAFEFAEKNRMKIRPSCSYVQHWLKKYPEWIKMVEE